MPRRPNFSQNERSDVLAPVRDDDRFVPRWNARDGEVGCAAAHPYPTVHGKRKTPWTTVSQARNQLILLGFICQGLSSDDYILPGLSLGLWIFCLKWAPRAVRLHPAVEGMVLLAGCAAGYLLGLLPERTPHFFLGHGLTALQAVRLLRPLNPREKLFSVVMACIQIGVGCATVLDYRFLLILAAILVLIPRVFVELQMESFDETPVNRRPRVTWPACATIAFCMVLFFLVFPRGLLNAPIRATRSARSAEGTLQDSVVDPSRGGSSQSGRVLLQIQGDQPGYLRCFALPDFDGLKWSSARLGTLVPIRMAPSDRLDESLRRRVRVKNVDYLGRILPTDGRVVQLKGNFFGRPMRNSHHAIECSSMWNTGNNTYEYWIDRSPWPGHLLHEGTAYAFVVRSNLTHHPPQSPRLQNWLDERLPGITNSLEQARVLESHLRNNFDYQIGAPELDRLSPVDDFVFNQREGHCERFAATLALLLRMKDIPSRVVIGYVPNRRSWFSGWYNVRFKDAHAWTEGWFPEIGWLQLDATPRASIDLAGWSMAELIETLDMAWYLYVVNFDAPTQNDLLAVSVQQLGALARWIQDRTPVLLMLILAGMLWIAWRRWWTRPGVSRDNAPRRANLVLAKHFYGRMLRELAQQGLHRAPHQTPFEFLTELHRRSASGFPDAEFITRLFCAARYGHQPVSPTQARELKRALDRIKNPDVSRAYR